MVSRGTVTLCSFSNLCQYLCSLSVVFAISEYSIYLPSQLLSAVSLFLPFFLAFSASHDVLRAGYQQFGMVSSARVVYLRLRFFFGYKDMLRQQCSGYLLLRMPVSLSLRYSFNGSVPVCSGISSAFSRYRNFVCSLLAILRMVSIGYCPVYGGSITYFQHRFDKSCRTELE